MATYVFSKNGMGNYTTGTGMREDMHMQYANIFNYRAGVVLTTDLAVTERAAGANMSVDVSAGRCFIQNSSYSANTANSTKYWGMLSDAVTNLVISTNTSGSTRIDKVVAKIDTTAIANDYATNVGSIIVVEGTPGAGTPATPSNCLLLATLTIPTGTTVSVTNAMITNGRVYPGLTLQTSYMIDDGTNLELHSTTGNVLVYDSTRDVHLRIMDSAGGSGYIDMYHNGTHGFISTGAGDLYITPAGGDARFSAGTRVLYQNSTDTTQAQLVMSTDFEITTTSGDISLTPTGGDVNLKGGTNLVLYNAANTQTFTIDVGTNTELLLTTGNIHIYDASHDVHLRIYDNAGGSNYLDMYHDGNGHIDTAAGDIHMKPAGGEVYVYDSTATDYLRLQPGASLGAIYSSTGLLFITGGGSKFATLSTDTNPKFTVFEGGSLATGIYLQHSGLSGGFGIINTVNTMRIQTASVGGATTGIDFDTGSDAEWILLPNVTADPGTLSDGMMWYRSDTDVLRVRVNGVTRSVTVT